MKVNWKLVAKLTTWPFVVPICALAAVLWPWWCRLSLWKKVVFAPLVLPITGFAAVSSFWWAGL